MNLSQAAIAAIANDDLDDAVRPIQDCFGVESGDTASEYFSNLEGDDPNSVWRNLEYDERRAHIIAYIKLEVIWLDTGETCYES